VEFAAEFGENQEQAGEEEPCDDAASANEAAPRNAVVATECRERGDYMLGEEEHQRGTDAINASSHAEVAGSDGKILK